jgi:hypothetical protein
MSAEQSSTTQESPKKKESYRGSSSDAVYGLGLLGAWAFYLTHAHSVWEGLLGIVQGVFWPAMVVYELLKYIYK